MKPTENQPVGAIVATDYRSAAVFQKFGIDFCCKGGQSLHDACAKKGVDPDLLINAVEAVTADTTPLANDFRSWPLDRLSDYIADTHHTFVREQIPVLLQFLKKLCKVHGERHPELFEIYAEFHDAADHLNLHMHKEEHILFPHIARMQSAMTAHEMLPPPAFGSVQHPIGMMMHEHETEGERFARMSELTSGYQPPEDACTTYRVAFQMLKEFEENLHLHIHLENNILFPAAAAMEKIHESAGEDVYPV